MGISIKHSEIEREIRTLASRRGTSLTDAIGQAVRAELARDTADQPLSSDRQTWLDEVKAIQAEVRRLTIDPTPYRELLYDEDGLPK